MRRPQRVTFTSVTSSMPSTCGAWRAQRAAAYLLRMEDHDRIRSKPEYEASILEDLVWLGFEPDAGCIRSSDKAIAEESTGTNWNSCAARHHVYACDCSRKHIAGERYDGFCRNRGIRPRRLVAACASAFDQGVETFTDRYLGGTEHEPARQCGDLLLRDRDGNWTYQFAVTVDDMMQEITDVIRGEDLALSTGRQLRLRRMLGTPAARILPTIRSILKSGGEKLSKSAADSGVRELRRAGLSLRST